MKHLLRVYLFHIFALWLSDQLLPGLSISGGLPGIMSTAVFLSLLMLLVAPVLKILFIPINILTFGLFSWFVNVAVVYVLTLLSTNVRIEAFLFDGIQWAGFTIPSFSVTYPVALILTSLTITIITNILEYASDS